MSEAGKSHIVCLTPALDGPALQQRAGVLPAGGHGRSRRLRAKVHVAKVVSHAADTVSPVGTVAEAELAVLVVTETLLCSVAWGWMGWGGQP